MVQQFGVNRIGEGAQIFDPVILGFPSREYLGRTEFPGTVLGNNAVIRSGTVIYCEVTIGDSFSTGHNVLIRERMTIRDRVAIGTGTVVEGYGSIGSDVRIQSMAFIPTHTIIGDNVFIGPHAVLTNDRYPPTARPALQGPTLERGAIIGANATILPSVVIGEGACIAAGAVVTRDVPPKTLAIGVPATFRELPLGLR